ncbi:hypothetical protein MMC24_006482 [Lignoscripta atroalba]|nr:hypothetical protein [Lignoscripta atroalba]
MGGKAFTHGISALSTPRMPPTIYIALRDKYISLLSTLFAEAASPIEAPEKDTYGDIDILVCGPKSPASIPSLTAALNSKSTVGNGVTASFAVPYPDSAVDYVQLDLHVCGPSTFRWELFTHSHGDLWNLLGTSIRPWGLTANDVGFHVRIREIEELDKKRSLVYLTSDPDAVIDFLGLERERYWQPFGTVEELYTYVTSMRFFRRDAYVRNGLKANDRKRMAQRPLYRRFVDEWLPQRPSLECVAVPNQLNRESVLDEALKVFDKRGEYEGILEKWRKEREELRIKQEEKYRRRAGVRTEIEYADAWIDASRQGLVPLIKSG